MMTRGGLDEKRIERIEGHADHTLKDTKDPNAAQNRRIEILLKVPKT
jgi:chemotaxis protein MotB